MIINHRIPLAISLLLPLLATSCKDDPAMVLKRETQRKEIEQLKGEIAIKEELFKALPSDRSNELEDAKKKAEMQTKEIEILESEIANLQTKKRTLEVEMEAYKKKYPVNR